MESSLFQYIWRHTKPQQLWLTVIIIFSLVPYYLSLDLPKRIVNGPIIGKGFDEGDAEMPLMRMNIDLPDWFGEIPPYLLFEGFNASQFTHLLVLSLMFLGFVCINGLFKLYINTYKGRLGERTLRRVRFELVDRVLRFPSAQFKRTKAPEIATMVKDEVEPLGGFIGDMISQPIFLGGQAITALIFIILQNFLLGTLAAGIVGVQALIIPRLRRRLLELGRRRQLTARQLAGNVGEIVESIASIRTNDTSNWERARISQLLGKIYYIRYELYQRKFAIKFLNNFLAQVTPFLFYLIGGYYAIRGELNIGQLIAVIAAYKDLPGPIRDLIAWDQRRLDVQIKYTQVIKQFNLDEMLEPEVQTPLETPVQPLSSNITFSRLEVVDDVGSKLIQGISFRMNIKEHIAAVGGINSGAETIADLLARLVAPTSGTVTLGDKHIDDLHEAITGRRFSYVGPDTYFPACSLRDALTYGLKHQPRGERELDPEEALELAKQRSDAKLSGNPQFDTQANWYDETVLEDSSEAKIDEWIYEIAGLVDFSTDISILGLRGNIDPRKHSALAEKFLEARSVFRQKLENAGKANLVEAFDPRTYTMQATLGENLLFGQVDEDQFDEDRLAENPQIYEILKETKLDYKLYEMGKKIAATTIDLFKDLSESNPFFDQLTFMTPEELPEFSNAITRVSGQKFADISDDDRTMFMQLPFEYIEPRHRFSLLDDELKKTVLIARNIIREKLSDKITFYNPLEFNPKASLQDNILLGRIAYGVAEGPEQVSELIQDVFEELSLHDEVFNVGLQFDIGNGGKRLNNAQRQKLALARALLKKPDLLIVNRALTAFDAGSQSKILKKIIAHSKQSDNNEPAFGIYWVLQNPEFADNFERVIVFDKGSVIEDDTPKKLIQKGNVYAKLLS